MYSNTILLQIARNIRQDLINVRNPIMIIVHPEMFNPPFISAINTADNEVLDSNIWLVVKLICCGLDIVCSMVRMVIASMLSGMIMVSYVVLTIFLYVTLRRRWRLLLEFMKNDMLII